VSNWFSRLISKDGIPFNAALQDVFSVLYPDKQQALITDARTGVDKSVWIYRAVNTVCTRIGSLPWHLYSGDKIHTGDDAILARPNPNQTGTEWVERIIAWELLQGTGMVYAEKPLALGLTVLDADMLRSDHGNLLYREISPTGQPTDRQLDRSRIVLFPNFSISGQLGLSELRPILDTANMDENGKSVWNNQMSAGGALSGLFTTDNRMDAAQMDAAKRSWEEKYGGIQKAGGVGWLSSGYHFEKLGISAADLKMLEVSSVTRQEIGTAFGVPPIFLGDMDNVAFASATIEEKILYTNTVIPKADRLADRITTFLLPLLGLKGLVFKFDYTGIECLQDDRLQRAQSDEIELRMGKLTINEICKRDNIKEKAWGNVWWASAMLVPITTSDLPEPPPPVALPATTPADVPVVPPVVPPDANSSPVAEPKGMKALHSPEARQLIAKSFLATVKPQEKKFMQATQRVFNKQAKLVSSWVEGGKSMIEPTREDCETLQKSMGLDEGDMVRIALDEYKLKEFRYKAAIVKPVRRLLDDSDFVDSWHSLFVSFGLTAAETVAARYGMAVPDGSRILAWIRAHETKQSTLVNNTTADEISQILADARANGQSIPEMVKATKQYFDGIAYRAERVARTNVIAVNNSAAQDTYVENGVKQHEWLATHDERTRGESNGHPNDEFDHMAADGEVVDITAPFMNTGGPLMYPGDPDGDPANTINCRCTILPVV